MKAQSDDSLQKIFDHRDALIRDRLWQMKKAARDIMNLIAIPPDGDCDGTCDACLLNALISPIMCSEISEIADYPLEQVEL